MTTVHGTDDGGPTDGHGQSVNGTRTLAACGTGVRSGGFRGLVSADFVAAFEAGC